MDRWVGKVAVVTGATSGIGAQIAKDLVNSGIVVVGLARKVERIEGVRDDVAADRRGLLHGMKCDITKEDDVVATFGEIVKVFGGVDILINSAGIGVTAVKLIERGNSSAINDTVQTNVMGLIYCTREAILSMKERRVAGQVVHISSIMGHKVIMPPPGLDNVHFNVYPATKFAVTALTESLRLEMVRDGEQEIRIGSVSPALVQTNFSDEYTPEKLKNVPHLLPSDVSQAVLYILSAPPHVNVQDIIIKPVGCRN